MNCAWCGKKLWLWQSTKPLGCGYLEDTFGQREHNECSDKRLKVIEEGNKQTNLMIRRVYEKRI